MSTPRETRELALRIAADFCGRIQYEDCSSIRYNKYKVIDVAKTFENYLNGVL